MLIELTKEEIKILRYCLGIEYGSGCIVDGVDCVKLMDILKGYIDET